MADATETAGMAVDWQVVRRVCEHHLRQIARHQASDGDHIPRIAAEQAVAAQAPEIAGAAYRRGFRLERRHLVGGGIVALAGRTLDQDIDFRRSKAGHRQVEFELQVGELGQLQRQQLVVPPRQLGQPVIGQNVGALPGRRHVVQSNRRHPLQAEQPGGCDSTMAGDDSARLVDQNGIGEAEGLDAVGELPDLAFGMAAGISGIGPQRLECPVLDLAR